MSEKRIHLFSGLADADAQEFGLKPESHRFSVALGVNPAAMEVHDMLAITRGQVPLPEINDADLVIFGGSPACILESSGAQEARERQLVEMVIDGSRKMLGVCYGFQLMIRAMGGEIGRAQPAERGFREVRFIEESALLQGITANPWVSTFHNDAVHGLPEGMVFITEDDGSGIQMAVGKSGTTLVAGMQFHPEVLAPDPIPLMAKLPPDPEAIVRIDTTREIEGPRMLRNALLVG